MTTNNFLQLCASMKYKTTNADATCSVTFLTSANFKWPVRNLAKLEMERTKALLLVPKVHLIIIHCSSKWSRVESRVRAEESCTRVKMKQNISCKDNYEGFGESEAKKR